MSAFFNRLLRKQKSFGFLSQLTDAQKVEVSNLDPMAYDALIQEKTCKDAPEVHIENSPHLAYMLRKLDIVDLQRLAEAVRQSRKGDDLASANAADGAIEYLEATKINPFLDIAFMSYGCTIANQGNLREGIKWVEKALAINPSNDRARRNLQAMKFISAPAYAPQPVALAPGKSWQPVIETRPRRVRRAVKKTPADSWKIERRLWSIWTGGNSDKAWGIEIGHSSLKALCCQRTQGGGLNPVAFDFIQYPQRLAPGADTTQLAQKAVSMFATRHNTKSMHVAIALPGNVGVARCLTLPPSDHKTSQNLLQQEIKKQIKFPWSETQWDYQELSGGDSELETEVKYSLCAAHRDAIELALRPLRAAQIPVTVAQLSPLAIHNFMAHELAVVSQQNNRGTKVAASSRIAIALGTETTDLVITDGIWHWHRSIPVGGNHFTRQLCKEFRLTLSDAERIKRNPQQAKDPKASLQAMRPVLNDLLTEVQRSIGFFCSVHRGVKIDGLMLLGSSVKLPGLAQYITRNLGYDVVESQALQVLSGNSVLQSPAFQDNKLSFGACYGLCMQALGHATLYTNLLPRHRTGLFRLLLSK